MPVVNISNAVIEEISSDRNTTFVTVRIRDGRRGNETLRLVVSDRTMILNPNGRPVPVRELRVGMIVDATVSSAMTRSIPPQTAAYVIRIVRRPGQREEQISEGRILEIDRGRRNFTTIRDRELSTMIRFQVPENTPVFDRMGRPMDFAGLRPGMRVRVRHANFMTASIPPQTTAFEVRVL